VIDRYLMIDNGRSQSTIIVHSFTIETLTFKIDRLPMPSWLSFAQNCLYKFKFGKCKNISCLT